MTQDIKNSKDLEERAKGPFAHFFISGWNHLVRLMGVNVLFMLFNIPALAIAAGFAIIFMPGLINAFDLGKFIRVPVNEGTITPAQTYAVSSELLMLLYVFFIVSIAASLLVCVGPFQAGFSQVYKDIRNGTSVSGREAELRSIWLCAAMPSLRDGRLSLSTAECRSRSCVLLRAVLWFVRTAVR